MIVITLVQMMMTFFLKSYSGCDGHGDDECTEKTLQQLSGGGTFSNCHLGEGGVSVHVQVQVHHLHRWDFFQPGLPPDQSATTFIRELIFVKLSSPSSNSCRHLHQNSNDPQAVYCSFPEQRTQPASEHKLKKEKDIVGRFHIIIILLLFLLLLLLK